MRKIILTSLVAVIFSGFCQVQAVEYYITDIGTLGSEPESIAHGINDYGMVVGYYGRVQSPEEGRRAFLWDITNGMQNLGTLGGNHSEAYDISNNGKIVGRSTLTSSEGDMRGFIWENGTMIDIGTLGEGWTEAHGINNSGQVVGYSVLSNYVAAFSREDGSMINLDSLSDNSRGYAINDAGQIVGHCSNSASFYTTASLWDNGYIISLGSLNDNYNYAWGINISGQIVGESGSHAFLWENEIDGMIDLGIGSAAAINDAGQVVGSFGLWENGKITPLVDLLPNSYGWTELYGRDINNLAQIIGEGYINGEIHAFLMTPVPEPATFFLLGLGGLLMERRKNNAKNNLDIHNNSTVWYMSNSGRSLVQQRLQHLHG